LSLANPFLSSVAEEDREVVSKYIKEWDSGVTKKFQEYSDKLKGYQSLGEIEQLQNASQFVKDLQSDPVGFFVSMRDYLVDNADQFDIENVQETLGVLQKMSEQQEDFNGGTPPEFEGLPPQFVDMFSKLQDTVGELSTNYNQTKSQIQEQEQMAMLDSVLTKMHTEHGDFDDTYVLTQIASGKSPEDAYASYQQLTESIINSHRKNPPPPIIGGPGGTPLDQVDPTKLTDAKSRKELGAAILARAASQQ